MAIRKCDRKFYKTVEVCGGVCECANSMRCAGCDYNRTGKAAQEIFKAACDREYPLGEF